MTDLTTSSDESMAAEIELLRAEVEQLQYDLAERDAQLTEMATSCSGGEQLDDAATDQLVGRLEQLLDELQHSDGRINALEQLLQAAEESSRAEQEERRQLEAWMTDIETRIAEREADWKAESKTLHRRVQQVSEQRDELLHKLQQPAAVTEQTDPDEAALESWQTEKAQLEQALTESRQEQARMAEQLQQQQEQLARSSEADAELREERLKLAQERASLTRQQAEVTAQRSEIENQPMRPASEIDGRISVFREHLREIHNTEEKQRSEQSLSSRVAQIWKRLETRI